MNRISKLRGEFRSDIARIVACEHLDELMSARSDDPGKGVACRPTPAL